MKIFLIMTLLITSIFANVLTSQIESVKTEVQEKKRSSWKKFVGHFNVSKQGKKVYSYVSDVSKKVKKDMKRLKSKVFTHDNNKHVNAAPVMVKLNKDERKESVIKQFLAKADILETQRVKKEIINVEDEIISFFNSFKYTKKNPINIE